MSSGSNIGSRNECLLVLGDGVRIKLDINAESGVNGLRGPITPERERRDRFFVIAGVKRGDPLNPRRFARELSASSGGFSVNESAAVMRPDTLDVTIRGTELAETEEKVDPGGSVLCRSKESFMVHFVALPSER